MLTHYFDITPKKKAFDLYWFIAMVMQRLHVFMWRGNNEGKRRAVGFPEYGDIRCRFGGIVRVFGEENDLLHIRDSLLCMKDDFFKTKSKVMHVREIPGEVKGHASFYRIHAKSMSTIRRLEKRSEKWDDDKIANTLNAYAARRDEPYLQLVSGKEHNFRLYIACETSAEPRPGDFGGYGLATGPEGERATVPLF